MKYILYILIPLFILQFLFLEGCFGQSLYNYKYEIRPYIGGVVPLNEQFREKVDYAGSLGLKMDFHVGKNFHLGGFVSYWYNKGNKEKFDYVTLEFPNLHNINYGFSLKKKFVNFYIEGEGGLMHRISYFKKSYYYISPNMGVDFEKWSLSLGAPLTFQYDRDVRPFSAVEVRFLKRFYFD